MPHLFGGCNLQGETMSVYRRGKKSPHWHYRFSVRGARYRGAIPEARTKWEAEQAESKLRQDIYEGRFGLVRSGTMKLNDFIDEIYLPWAKANKRSWKGDSHYGTVLKEYFEGKTLSEVTPLLIEKFKHQRIKTPTKHGTTRALASVNREFEMLSRMFNLAIDFGKAESNPCSRVKKFRLDNERYRYLLPEEEPMLMSALIGKRAHLEGMVTVALGLGLRKREQLNLRRDQVDFPRNVVIAARTKGRKNREIPTDILNPDVRTVLLELCHGRKPDDFVFANPKTGKPFTDIKRSFHTACRMVGIQNLWWHDLRATFCTRLALAGYEALTIMTLMGHKDLKTTMRYIRAVQLQRQIRPERSGHKLDTNEIRPPALAAVNY
jgi:integrase